MSPAWRKDEADAIVLTLHVQPGASRTEVVGAHGDALRIRLAARPVDGKANALLLRYLAEMFGVPVRNVMLLRGESARRKLVRIASPVLRPDIAW